MTQGVPKQQDETTATLPTGTPVTYLGSMWTEPAEGWVVRDTGDRKVAVRVRRPYEDAFAPKWLSLRVRRTSLTAANISIADNLQLRQAEFLSQRTVPELIRDTGMWTQYAERSSHKDYLATATEALRALATEQHRRCVVDPAAAYDRASAMELPPENADGPASAGPSGQPDDPHPLTAFR